MDQTGKLENIWNWTKVRETAYQNKWDAVKKCVQDNPRNYRPTLKKKKDFKPVI